MHLKDVLYIAYKDKLLIFNPSEYLYCMNSDPTDLLCYLIPF